MHDTQAPSAGRSMAQTTEQGQPSIDSLDSIAEKNREREKTSIQSRVPAVGREQWLRCRFLRKPRKPNSSPEKAFFSISLSFCAFYAFHDYSPTLRQAIRASNDGAQRSDRPACPSVRTSSGKEGAPQIRLVTLAATGAATGRNRVKARAMVECPRIWPASRQGWPQFFPSRLGAGEVFTGVTPNTITLQANGATIAQILQRFQKLANVE